ncbi:alpha/beta hydrolase [Mycobacterium sp. 29Ha]|uniref:alpha/beta hydrolase n=1 Tax=Mycobacterium TaxID=1763 RepID=UPI003977A43F
MDQPRMTSQTGDSRGRRPRRAKPGDYLVALSAATASVPVIGRHLELIGGFAALGVGGRHYLPGILTGIAQPRLSPRAAKRRREQRASTPSVLSEALYGIVDPADLDQPWPSHPNVAPLWKARGQRRYVHRSSVCYGDHPRQLLDVWRLDDLPREPAPVLIFIPGGAWVFGRRELQGHALMAHMARRGWVCLSVEYRTSPHHRWPRQMQDVTAAVAWARANADQFGGDPDFLAVAGTSAGGHLASLVGLASDAETSVDAVVSIYGLYDWQDRSTRERDHFMRFLERIVVKRSQARHPEVFLAASPIDQTHALAPPFLVVHGSADALIPVAEARSFVARLRAVSRAKVGYIELPGLGHGFDLIDATHTAPVIAAIGRFLTQIHRDHAAARVGRRRPRQLPKPV